jgi:hypothetical protein
MAFARALEGEYAAEIDLTPVTGMNVDMVAVLIQRAEKFRDEADENPSRAQVRWKQRPHDEKKTRLNLMVEEACRIAEVDPDHRHGYEVLVMCYYRQMFEFKYPQLARKEPLPQATL